jgi:hypothetical protein
MRRIAYVFTAVGMALIVARTRASEPLTDASFQQLHAKIGGATKAEKWTEIPWLTDLAEARKLAARDGKPIFMWAMNGHPLGCT